METDIANIQKCVLLKLCYVYFWMNQGMYFVKDGQFLTILAGLFLNIRCVDCRIHKYVCAIVCTYRDSGMFEKGICPMSVE